MAASESLSLAAIEARQASTAVLEHELQRLPTVRLETTLVSIRVATAR